MIVSTNSEPHKEEFEKLLYDTIQCLNVSTNENSSFRESLKGRNLEPYVAKVLMKNAIGTPFEGTIEEIGGQKFPDIIANKYYGIELKTTIKDHWKTIGNSVMETTRVEDVERIYMLFAKLTNPIEFKCRPYEEVLSEVVVTHSPRYQIDMNLEKGKTIFDKINMPYDVLRKKDNPIKHIVDYYKTKLKPGEQFWWMDSEVKESNNNFIIRMWNNLPQSERNLLIVDAMIFFPEIFGKNSDKYERVALWLLNSHTIICSNLRDVFTAGGTKNIQVAGNRYSKVPMIYFKLFKNIELLKNRINDIPSEELKYHWNVSVNENNKIEIWFKLFSKNIKETDFYKKIQIDSVFKDLILS